MINYLKNYIMVKFKINKIPAIENINNIRCVDDYNQSEIQKQINEYAKSIERIKMVDLSDKKLSLLLDEHSCYGVKCGKCSLYLSQNECIHGVSFCKNDECQEICKSIVNGVKYDSIFNSSDNLKLNLNSCGHWTVNGQHRICVLKRLGLIIPINIDEYNDQECTIKCRFCYKNGGYELL